MPRRVSPRQVVDGTISSCGFADGHRCAIGHWPTTPLGPFADVMWVEPDGRRVLLAPRDDVADFVGAIYRFDETRVGDLDVGSDGRRTTVAGLGFEIELCGGRRRSWLPPRPLAVTRHVEGPIARRLMGVNTFGTSPTGAREWYQARGWRWVTGGRAVVHGRDLGPPTEIGEPLGVGFSEPPPRPSIVAVRVTIEMPDRWVP